MKYEETDDSTMKYEETDGSTVNYEEYLSYLG